MHFDNSNLLQTNGYAIVQTPATSSVVGLPADCWSYL